MRCWTLLGLALMLFGACGGGSGGAAAVVIDGSSYSLSTTTAPLTAGNQLTLIFSYNTVTLQEATQFQSGPIHLFGQAGESLGTASVLYR